MARHVLHIGVLAEISGPLKCEESPWKATPGPRRPQWNATAFGLNNMKHRTCILALTGWMAGWLFLGSAQAAPDSNATEAKPDANATEVSSAATPPPHESAASRKMYGLDQVETPAAPQPANMMAVAFRILGALLLVLALLLGGAWWFRRSRLFGLVPPSEARLKILETKSLGSRHAMHVVEYGEQRFLISDSPAGTNFLTHLADPGEEPPVEEELPETSVTGSFADKLKSLISRAS